MYDYIKYELSLQKKIDKLFNWKYLFLVQVNDFLCSDSEYRYNIDFSISKKNDTFYWSDYVWIYENYWNDLKELWNDLMKYVKKSLKDWYFYRKSKNVYLPDTYLWFNELFICKDYKE